ncbi:unnamed protein product [Linum trigynum]|uniref:Retrotransposon gag domain-containing protein n=1 Tax=Linum trigynum TaxID=586398 RepID=A0AAV2ECS1_9ROSI
MTKIEKYFRYQDILEERKVALASFHMKGDANKWIMWIEEEFTQSGMEMTWEDFRAEFWKRFRASEKTTGHEAF